MKDQQKEDTLTLELLEAIEGRDDITQRHLADRLGVALGLANSYLKRCVRKGLIKVRQAPSNRYLYYLTPKGFSEKSRLTMHFFSASFQFYRRASDSYAEIMRQCVVAGDKKIVLCGLSELAEIASLRAQESRVEVIAVFDPWTRENNFLHVPVLTECSEIPKVDSLILTALNKPEQMLNELSAYNSISYLRVPDFLSFAQPPKDYIVLKNQRY